MAKWGDGPSQGYIIDVVTTIRDGSGERTEHWSYQGNRHLGFVPKLGRRVGKHGPQKKAHCTEGETLRAMAHREEVSNGYKQYRQNLAHFRDTWGPPAKARQQQESPTHNQPSVNIIRCAPAPWLIDDEE